MYIYNENKIISISHIKTKVISDFRKLIRNKIFVLTSKYSITLMATNNKMFSKFFKRRVTHL